MKIKYQKMFSKMNEKISDDKRYTESEKRLTFYKKREKSIWDKVQILVSLAGGQKLDIE